MLRDTGENQVVAAEGREQDRRQRSGVDLADAGLGQDDGSRAVWNLPLPELETGNGRGLLVELEPVVKSIKLFRCAQEGVPLVIESPTSEGLELGSSTRHSVLHFSRCPEPQDQVRICNLEKVFYAHAGRETVMKYLFPVGIQRYPGQPILGRASIKAFIMRQTRWE